MKIDFSKEEINKICKNGKYYIIAYKTFYKIKVNGDLYKNGYILEKLATIQDSIGYTQKGRFFLLTENEIAKIWNNYIKENKLYMPLWIENK